MTYFNGVLSEMDILYNSKQDDYVGEDADSLASFRLSSELLDIPIPKLILSRCIDKLRRASILIKGSGRNPSVKDESIRETILDLAVYSAMLVEALDESYSLQGEVLDGREDSDYTDALHVKNCETCTEAVNRIKVYPMPTTTVNELMEDGGKGG